jgi:hypothetical protein
MSSGGSFTLSRKDAKLARFLTARRNGALSMADLEFDRFSSYWRDMVELVHAHHGDGHDETIAVIDSGFAARGDDIPIDTALSRDLTGEGIADRVGHGTAVSALIHAIAPRARQYHVKVFDAHGRMGDASEAEVARIALAFEYIERTPATMVNISWNKLTTLTTHAPRDVRPGHFCQCPVCAIIAAYVDRTNVDVFVSQGNFRRTRPEGSWSCPAAATLVVPVIALADGDQAYDANIDYTAGVQAPASVTIDMHRRWMRRTMSVSGSSFATPLVAATFAAIKSAFRDREYGGPFEVPKSKEGAETATTSYNWPLELFFIPPDAPIERIQGRHTEWVIVSVNCETQARRLAEKGDRASAGELCGLMAEILLIAYRRMERWPFNPDIGMLGLYHYLAAIGYLHASDMPFSAARYFPGAHELIGLLGTRGRPIDEPAAQFARLVQQHRQIMTELDELDERLLDDQPPPS